MFVAGVKFVATLIGFGVLLLLGGCIALVALAVHAIWLAAIVLFLLVVNFGWLADNAATVVSVRWVRLPSALSSPACPTNVVLWHLSKSEAEAFAGGVEFDRVRVDFLGPGFYVWMTAAGAERYVVPAARTMLRLEIDAAKWHTLSRQRVRSKLDPRYMVLTHLWMCKDVRRFASWRRRVATQVVGPGDLVEAPAIGIRARERQVLLRHTDGVVDLLADAGITAYKVLPGVLRTAVDPVGTLVRQGPCPPLQTAAPSE